MAIVLTIVTISLSGKYIIYHEVFVLFWMKIEIGQDIYSSIYNVFSLVNVFFSPNILVLIGKKNYFSISLSCEFEYSWNLKKREKLLYPSVQTKTYSFLHFLFFFLCWQFLNQIYTKYFAKLFLDVLLKIMDKHAHVFFKRYTYAAKIFLEFVT